MVDEVPEWAMRLIREGQEGSFKSAQAIEGFSKELGRFNDNFPKFVEALNSNFATHNADTGKLCAEISGYNKSVTGFKDEVWTRTWGLLEKVVLVTVGVLAGTFGGAELIKVIVGV